MRGTSVSGSILTTTSDTYAFTISEEERYFLQFRITDANGDSLTFRSPSYATPSEELSVKVQEIVNACAGDVEIVEYTKCKDWIVEYTFAEPGMYNLWYRASADGVDMNQPYTADPVNIGEADEEELVYGDFSYVLNEEGTGVVIASYLGSEADVVVPDAIGGIPVTEIGNDAFLNNATLTRITLPQTVERIGARAFKNCTALCEMN